MVDTLLNLDVGQKDGVYRICRVENSIPRVIYVFVSDISYLPELSRTSEQELLSNLRRLERWNDTWDTLTVSGSGAVQCDAFTPHHLCTNEIEHNYPSFNVLDFQILSQKKSRVQEVQINSKTCYLKIARFRFELPALRRENRVYLAIQKSDPTLAPPLIGYAYEGSRERVVGILLEGLDGRCPDIQDLLPCQNIYRKLHGVGIIHKDVRKDNILVTNNGIKIIDFENAIICSTTYPEDSERQKAEEIKTLASALSEDSEVGAPWDA